MALKVVTMAELRREVLPEAERTGSTVSEACRLYGIAPIGSSAVLRNPRVSGHTRRSGAALSYCRPLASIRTQSLHRLDLGLDERDLPGVKAVLCIQLQVDLRDRLLPVNIRRASEILHGNVFPCLRGVVLGDL